MNSGYPGLRAPGDKSEQVLSEQVLLTTVEVALIPTVEHIDLTPEKERNYSKPIEGNTTIHHASEFKVD